MTRKDFLVWIILAGVAAIFVFSAGYPRDGDSLYHIKHSWIYRMNGIFFSEFPWVQFSVIRTSAADLWYGFHIASIPLTYFEDLFEGLRIGRLFTLSFLLTSIYISLRLLRIPYAVGFLILIIFSSSSFLFRITVFRPFPVSLGLCVLILALLLRNFEDKHRNVKLFCLGVAGFLLAWVQLTVSWVAVLMLGIVMTVKFVLKDKLSWWEAGAIFGGLALGWLARPNPLGATELLYVQLVQLAIVKWQGVPLAYSQELVPLGLAGLYPRYLPVAVLFVGTTSVFLSGAIRRFRQGNAMADSAVWTSFLLAIFFWGMVVFSSVRGIDFALPFTGVFAGLVFAGQNRQTTFSWRMNFLEFVKQNRIFVLLLIIWLVTLINTLSIYRNFFSSRPLPQYKDAALWLKDNAVPGETIFNTSWDHFPYLFFYNENNYYINGNDPIFSYSYNPIAHWQAHFFELDKVTVFTCASAPCRKDAIVDAHDALMNTFHASYLYIRHRNTPQLYWYVNQKPLLYKKVFDDGVEAVFQILPSIKK